MNLTKLFGIILGIHLCVPKLINMLQLQLLHHIRGKVNVRFVQVDESCYTERKVYRNR